MARKNTQDIERDRILAPELSTIRYKTFMEAIHGEASVGSQDYKVITFNFSEDRSIVFLTMRGKIFLARDNARPVELHNFLYWSDLPEEVKSQVQLLSHDSPLNEHVLSIVSDRASAATSVLRGAIRDSTEEAIVYVTENFDSYVSIETEVASKPPAAVKLLSNQGFPFEKLEKIADDVVKTRENLKRMLGISDFPSSNVTLHLSKTVADDTYEARFIMGAADVDCTLEDMWDQSAGFNWQSILEKLLELVTNEAIVLGIPKDFEELPSDFVVSMSYEKLFKLTKHISEDLTDLTKRVFVVSADLDMALRIVEDNHELEEKLTEIEDFLISTVVKEKYNHFGDLDDEAQANVRVLVLERREVNAKRAALLEKLYGLIVDDTTSTVDDELRKLIAAKMRGISGATDVIPFATDESFESDFDIPAEPPIFNFRDGEIIVVNGESKVREEGYENYPFWVKPRTPTQLQVDIDMLANHVKTLNQKAVEFREKGLPKFEPPVFTPKNPDAWK